VELLEWPLYPSSNKPAKGASFMETDVLRRALGVKPQLHGNVGECSRIKLLKMKALEIIAYVHRKQASR
jgi:hypothetical protein